jgi:hypothetical protein
LFQDVLNKVNKVIINTSSTTTDSTANQEPPRKRQRNQSSVSSTPPIIEPPTHINLDNVDTIDLANIKIEPETLDLLDIEQVSLPALQSIPHNRTDTPVAGPSNESLASQTLQSSSHNQNANSQISEGIVYTYIII